MNMEDAFSGVVSKEVLPLLKQIEVLTKSVCLMSDEIRTMKFKQSYKVKERLLSLKDVMEIVGKRKVWIYNQIQLGEFPEQRKMGRSSFWVEEEIYQWVDKQKAK